MESAAARSRRLAKNRQKYRENPEPWKKRQRKSDLKRFYGLTEERFAEMLAETGGYCPICEHAMTPPAVDHDHETGEVRGLLCRRCNSALGMLRDDPITIERAANYLWRIRLLRSFDDPDNLTPGELKLLFDHMD
jgi:hypothetical protein